MGKVMAFTIRFDDDAFGGGEERIDGIAATIARTMMAVDRVLRLGGSNGPIVDSDGEVIGSWVQKS